MPTDADLISRYVATKDAAAFGELVKRYLPLVHGSAWRRTGDAAMADDVSQVVMWILARKAGELHTRQPLADWLVTVTRYAAANAMRQRQRRRRHEAGAARPEIVMPNVDERDDQDSWIMRLDAALDRLRPIDRQAILLRYYCDEKFDDVARELRITERAARKRVARAVIKLRTLLGRHGCDASAMALPGGLHNVLTTPPPPALVIDPASLTSQQQTIATWALRSMYAAAVAVTTAATTVGIIVLALVGATFYWASPPPPAVALGPPVMPPTTLPTSDWYRERQSVALPNSEVFYEPRTGRSIHWVTKDGHSRVNMVIDPVRKMIGLYPMIGKAYYLGDLQDPESNIFLLESNLRQIFKTDPRAEEATITERLDGPDRVFDVTAGADGLQFLPFTDMRGVRRCAIRCDLKSGIVHQVEVPAADGISAPKVLWWLEPAVPPVDAAHVEKLAPPGIQLIDNRLDKATRELVDQLKAITDDNMGIHAAVEIARPLDGTTGRATNQWASLSICAGTSERFVIANWGVAVPSAMNQGAISPPKGWPNPTLADAIAAVGNHRPYFYAVFDGKEYFQNWRRPGDDEGWRWPDRWDAQETWRTYSIVGHWFMGWGDMRWRTVRTERPNHQTQLDQDVYEFAPDGVTLRLMPQSRMQLIGGPHWRPAKIVKIFDAPDESPPLLHRTTYDHFRFETPAKDNPSPTRIEWRENDAYGKKETLSSHVVIAGDIKDIPAEWFTDPAFHWGR